MKKFLATLLLAAVMLTGASFCVEYEPAAALEPVATPVHAVAEQVNLTEKRADIPQPVVSKAPVVQPEEPMEEPNAVTLELVNKSGSWFSVGDERIGQGRDNAKQYIADHPERLESYSLRR